MPGVAPRERTAVLVVRAWPQGNPPRLAARITSTFDVSQPERETLAATGTDEIASVVARWLDEFARLTAAGDGPVTGA